MLGTSLKCSMLCLEQFDSSMGTMMHSMRITVPAVLAVLVAATSCAPTQPDPASDTPSPQLRLSSTLTCGDAWAGSPPPAPRAPTAEGVSSLAWEGSPASYSWPIQDEMNGYSYTGTGGTKYGAWKTPITVAAGAGKRTITIDTPTDALLIVASATEWETSEALRQGDLDLPSSYTVSACEDRPTQFPGMTLVQGPACVVIRVTEAATGRFSTVSVPMYGGNCS
ncbi:hypothetical protein J2T10_004056 [Paenarthrobacter nicotinovorans]|uniref:Lipoprotein n=1 Tax=Paenarthrobacter nicotinovorans TaxID=29320 RepID=A0ABT9TVH3_PAENI|nr:hypothetical protein [Paenarthrobacter nicotinovorans]